MYCAKCGNMNSDDSKFCQKCGATMPPKADTPIQISNPVQPPYIPPQNTVYPPPAGMPPQGGGYVPPPGGGYVPPPGGGYRPPNMGYGPAMGGNFSPKPPKKKNPVAAAAGILAGLAVVVAAVVLLATMEPDKGIKPDASQNVLVDNGDTSPGGGASAEPDNGIRDNYTQILGSGQDTVTVMIYLCGADLESDGGCGTLDINEMLAADLGDNVNVVIETGGCTYWSTPGILDGEVQRWAIEDGALVELEQLGQMPMLDSGALSDFISFSAENFPANRYELIFWDHGGGSLYGYGYDEMYPDTVMFLTDIASALQSSGIKFDIVGFDACLMGTIETAYMLEPYADYLVGSEETEPSFGWDYTPWLNALGEDPSIAPVELGKVIVDSFLQQNAPSEDDQGSTDNTLSVVELSAIPGVYAELCDYMTNATDALANKEFKTISSAVARSRAFAEGDFDLIDIMDFANKADLEGLDQLSSALENAVKYSDSTARTGVYGLSMYFPYKDLTVYEYAKDMFSEFGYGGSIYDFYDTFASILADGQSSSSSRSLMETLTGQEEAQTDYSGYAWYNDTSGDAYADESIDYTSLEILQDEETGIWYLPMTDEDWDLLTGVEMQILFDDGEGYIDLGSDQYWETDDAGNLLLNYGADNTWYAIDGQIVCYYALETIYTETDTIFLGYVPAVLNGTTDIDIIIERDGENGEDYIAGYRLTESNSEIGGEGTLGKGYKQLKPGDTLDFICDYYTYDGDFDDSYYFGETLTIGMSAPLVTYEDVGDNNVLECYMLIDIYQNYSWTEYIEFSVDY